VLPDGRRLAGAIGTGRGFPYKVWVAARPVHSAAKLVFLDASGKQVAHVNVPPIPPPQSGPQPPRAGGVPLFNYQYQRANPSTRGTMLAFLRAGHVEFWTSQGDGPFGPRVPVNSGPVLSGRWGDYLAFGQLEWFGVARADAAEVTVRLADGRTVSAATFHPDWGTRGRLFAVRMPQDLYGKGGVGGPPHGTATAYDSAGHVLARVPLGIQ
jgi:hypothetical protein